MLSQAAQIICQLREGDVAQKIAAVKEAALYVEDRSYFPEAISFLLKFLEQERYPQLAEESALALWKFKERRVVPALMKKAREGRLTGVREKAIRALGLSQAKETLSFFREIIFSPNHFGAEEKAAAIFSLGFFGQEKDLWILKRALDNPHPLIRREAINALVHFFGNNPNRLPFFMRKKIGRMTLPRFEDSGLVRAAALVVLAEIEKERAENLSFRGLRDISWDVRYAACQLLADLVSQQRIQDWPQALSALEIALEVLPSRFKDLRKLAESTIQARAYA